MDFLLWIRTYHQSPNFEASECSGENLSNFPCHFWKHNSVFLQVLYQCSLSSNIDSMNFLSSNITHFAQKQPVKVKIFQIFECSGQDLLNSSRQFGLTSQFFLKYCIIVHCHDVQLLVNFKLIDLLLLMKGSHQSPNCQIFECSGENLPHSFYHFPNHKSVFLQILNQSPLS